VHECGARAAQITEKADIYSFGVLIWEVCTGEQPTSRYLRDLAPEEAPLAVRELFRACVREEPDARPSAKEVLEALQRA
jgi:serine/threonine protein kinase